MDINSIANSCVSIFDNQKQTRIMMTCTVNYLIKAQDVCLILMLLGGVKLIRSVSWKEVFFLQTVVLRFINNAFHFLYTGMPTKLHVIGFPEGGTPWQMWGLCKCLVQLPHLMGHYFFIKSLTLSLIPGALQLHK